MGLKLRWPRLLIRFTHSPKFESACAKVFQDTDTDRDQELNYSELYVAVLKLYANLNRVLPCQLRIPTNEDMSATLAKFDKDQSGKLNYQEFLEFCRSLVGRPGPFWDSLLFKALAVIAIKLVVIPLAAKGIKEGAKLAGVSERVVEPVPNNALALGLELAAKSTLSPLVPL